MRTHGGTNTKLFSVWSNMRRRCCDPKHHNYHLYGGRGIRVCAEWLDFEVFRNDVKGIPFEGATLDRIDNNGDYCKHNCRWSDGKTQGRNRRTNKVLVYKGVARCMTEWAEILGMKMESLQYRIRVGWSIERAFETPINTLYSRNSTK